MITSQLGEVMSALGQSATAAALLTVGGRVTWQSAPSLHAMHLIFRLNLSFGANLKSASLYMRCVWWEPLAVRQPS